MVAKACAPSSLRNEPLILSCSFTMRSALSPVLLSKGTALGHAYLDPGDLEHLPAHLADDVGPGQVGAASPAVHGWVHDDLVGDTSGQMRSRGAGLLALSPTRRSPRGASFGARLAGSHGILRRRLRRVL